jgi:hypothetical protein
VNIFVLAGFGAPLFDSIKHIITKERSDILVVGTAIKTSHRYQYSDEDIRELVIGVQSAASNWIRSGKAAFLCLVFIGHDGYGQLVRTFAPSAITFHLPPDTNFLSASDSNHRVMGCIRIFPKAAPELNSIFESRIRKTGWALPLVNYRIEAYAECLSRKTCLTPASEIALGEENEPELPVHAVTRPKVKVFTDDRQMLFYPAKRREFHGCEVAPDKTMAWLRGFFRIGRSLPVGFHYDAVPLRAPISRFKFYDCEQGEIAPGSQHTYANVTPNDRIRFGKRS